jgi:predicted RNase H-like HicB family nuclease
MAIKNDHYTYRVRWLLEDDEYVGLCSEFSGLSWLAKTPESALKGIRNTVADVIEDMKNNKEELLEPVAVKH